MKLPINLCVIKIFFFIYFRLLAVAGVKENINGELESTSKPFICPHDGHFGDPDDCTKFYKCAHGTPIAEYCPATLFWNQGEYRSDIKTLYLYI